MRNRTEELRVDDREMHRPQLWVKRITTAVSLLDSDNELNKIRTAIARFITGGMSPPRHTILDYQRDTCCRRIITARFPTDAATPAEPAYTEEHLAVDFDDTSFTYDPMGSALRPPDRSRARSQVDVSLTRMRSRSQEGVVIAANRIQSFYDLIELAKKRTDKAGIERAQVGDYLRTFTDHPLCSCTFTGTLVWETGNGIQTAPVLSVALSHHINGSLSILPTDARTHLSYPRTMFPGQEEDIQQFYTLYHTLRTIGSL